MLIEKTKTLIVKSFGSEKYIRETYGVTDAKAWAKEQVRLMNEAEKEDSAKFNIALCPGIDLAMNEQCRFNGGCRSFITTQSIQKLKAHLKEWHLNPEGWQFSGNPSGWVYNIWEPDDKGDKEKVFFKSHWINEKSRDVTCIHKILKSPTSRFYAVCGTFLSKHCQTLDYITYFYNVK